MTTKREALDALRAAGDPAKAAEMHRYHKVDRPYLGLANPVIDEMVKEWRAEDDLDARLTLARGLWKSNVHEARIAAAKLLVQARIRPDDSEAWALIASWVPDLDDEAIADQVSTAGQKRLVADPTRLDQVAEWAVSNHMWTRRAALTMTLPWTKKNNPKPTDLAVRDRVMGWAAGYITDQDRQIQKALGLWLRELSKHDADRVQMFLTRHGADMKPSTVKTAQRNLPA
ncbi:DNA alkylation repair protein [Yoonia maritima]|uniref:DNA alkylation repair protein n=1 Tax=Yoonia maritima TaxID=1435347 RepID=UPI000D113520|nr:DNA alkylation repair protein [Yoonia maritima]